MVGEKGGKMWGTLSRKNRVTGYSSVPRYPVARKRVMGSGCAGWCSHAKGPDLLAIQFGSRDKIVEYHVMCPDFLEHLLGI